MEFLDGIVVKERLTGRTLVIQEREKKKLEILLYSGWIVVKDEKKPEPEPILSPPVENQEIVVVAVEEPAVVETASQAEPELINDTEIEPTLVVEAEIVSEQDEDVPSFPMPATEPRKARLHAPKTKKTLKLPDDYA